MKRFETRAALVAALMLAGCGPAQTPYTEPFANTVSTEIGTEPIATPTPTPAPVANEASPAPVQLTPEAERGETGARDVLLDFARAIELRRFDQAWALLSPADKAKWSKAAFAAIFADLGKITVAVPTGTMEGAAGSSYYTAPVTITANDKSGRPVRYEGEAVLRRVNDVPGATGAQLRWHFETLKLDWVH